MNKEKGYLSFILHAHLPFVYHPESEEYIEEHWLYEAISETYIPLLSNFKKLEEENVDFRITMSFTPPLLHMLSNELLQQRYIQHLHERIELCEKEIKRTSDNIELNQLSKYYLDKFTSDLHIFENIYNCNIITGFKHFQDKGCLEIITCGATHGFFPLLATNENTVKAQIAVGVQTYKEFFGKKPRGLWLPECGYVPESDKYLKEFGIDYVITETHGILYADPKPLYGTFTPIVSNEGVIAFGRDIESSKQVWSSIVGYPGDLNYREYFRDIGYEADYDYIKPYIAHNGVRINTGIKYHRITSKEGDYKEYYNINNALNIAEQQAGHFLDSRVEQVNDLSHFMDVPPIIVCPYDAELYGHWWYEGPYWLYILFKKIYFDDCNFSLITPGEYIDKFPDIQVSQPARSSWGRNGFNDMWVNDSNDYVHRHLHKIGNKMVELANTFPNETDDLKLRALNQCAREVLLAQSSDWLFIISTGTMVEYAKKRIKEHTGRFYKLYDQLIDGKIDKKFLAMIEKKDEIFKNIDYMIYR